MDTTEKFSFILTKTQRDAFIAHWKHLHSVNHHFDGYDYFLFQILKSATPDIEKNCKRAFNPRKGFSFSSTIQAVSQNAIYTLTYARAAFAAKPIFGGIKLTDEQMDVIATTISQLYKA